MLTKVELRLQQPSLHREELAVEDAVRPDDALGVDELLVARLLRGEEINLRTARSDLGADGGGHPLLPRLLEETLLCLREHERRVALEPGGGEVLRQRAVGAREQHVNKGVLDVQEQPRGRAEGVALLLPRLGLGVAAALGVLRRGKQRIFLVLAYGS